MNCDDENCVVENEVGSVNLNKECASNIFSKAVTVPETCTTGHQPVTVSDGAELVSATGRMWPIVSCDYRKRITY